MSGKVVPRMVVDSLSELQFEANRSQATSANVEHRIKSLSMRRLVEMTVLMGEAIER